MVYLELYSYVIVTSFNNIAIERYYNQVCGPLYLWLLISVHNQNCKIILDDLGKTEVYKSTVKYSLVPKSILRTLRLFGEE